MDSGSPISIDYNFPIVRGAPAAADKPEQRFPDDSASPETTTRYESKAQATYNRASIDSAFEQEVFGQWSPSQRSAPRESESAASPGKDVDSTLDRRPGEEDRPPAWSELKTKAGKERKRLPLACIACRRKKIKCSGEKPACKHCLRARVPCVYKVTTRKAAPRTDYMAMLDKRLKRMEERVIKMIPKDDLPIMNVTGRSFVKPPLPGQPVAKEKITTNKRSAEEAFNSELQDWIEKRQTSNALEGVARPRPPREIENKLFSEGFDALPPQHIQEHLAEVFFDCVYGQAYLLLHKPSFMRKLKAGNIPPVLTLAVCAIAARFSTHPQVSTEPCFLRGEQWATPARNIVEKRHFEPNITILTVMVILGLHYFGTCEGGLSWSFGGQAMRMGYALQLHQEIDQDPLGRGQVERASAAGQETPKFPELSFTDREIRRRLMWACYLMDTFNSSGTERPSFLSEEYFKIQLPIKESHFQLEVPGLTEDLEGHVPVTDNQTISQEQAQAEARADMGVAAYIVRAVVIWKRIVKYLNLGGKEKDSYAMWDSLSQFASLQRQIAELKSRLPESLRYTPENLANHVSERLANQYLFLHIIIAQTGLFLHRFAIPTAPNVHRSYPSNTPKAFLTSAAKKVIESAGMISQIIADSTGHTMVAPFAGYCTYASATVHVWGIFSRNTALAAASKESLRHNYKYLNRMKKYWGMFHYMAESIKDIYRAFADAASDLHMPAQTKVVEDGGASAIDTLAISTEPSRAATPTPGGEAHASNASEASSDTTRSGHVKSRSGKPMFQYGDWFDKYPHGVSESEWEISHLPHKKEAQKSNEAVMSQQSELQSVEEFFASLSPPSKADNEVSHSSRRKKVPRQRGKSVADSGNNATPTDRSKEQRQRQGSQSASQPQIQQSRSHDQIQNTVNATAISSHVSTPDIDIPMSEFSSSRQFPLRSQAATAFDMSSPSLYQSGQYSGSMGTPIAASFEYNTPPAPTSVPSSNVPTSNPNGNMMNFNFNYASGLPYLDRQMVYGAYAGLDPSSMSNSGALNNPNNLDFWANPWDMVDMGGLDFNNTSSGEPSGTMSNPPTGNQSYMGNQMAPNMGGINSSAWFMPFNIDPPNYADMEEMSGFEAMDTGGDNGQGS